MMLMIVDVSKRCRRWCKASILTHMLMLMVMLVLMVCPAVAEKPSKGNINVENNVSLSSLDVCVQLCNDSTTHTFLLVLKKNFSFHAIVSVSLRSNFYFR